MTRQVSEKWNEMGESMGVMSYIVEKVDSLMTIVDSLSNSKLGRAEMKIRQQDPYFTLEALQDWVQQDLFPRFLQAKKLDEFLSKHTGEAVRYLQSVSTAHMLTITGIDKTHVARERSISFGIFTQ